MRNIRVAAASINQTPLDWHGNKRRIVEVIEEARRRGVSILCLQEMVTTGYNAEDWFLSRDVQQRALKMVRDIAPLTAPSTPGGHGMFVTLGLPIMYRNSLFNAVAAVANGRIIGFPCKPDLANDGIHYEERWFRAWPRGKQGIYRDEEGNTYPLGYIYFDLGGVRVALEICEAAFVAERSGADLGLKGVDIMLNPSASHFQFDKMATRRDLVVGGSRSFGLSYIYANALGNEAGRAIYDGGPMIASAGSLLAVGERFSFREWELIDTVIDVDRTRHAQASTASRKPRLDDAPRECVFEPFAYPEIPAERTVLHQAAWETDAVNLKFEEFTRAQALALFDYMRKSRSEGFVNSLSGGCDSTAIVVLVRMMVEMGVRQLGLRGFKDRLSYMRNLAQARTRRQLVDALLHNIYQGTVNSSTTTRQAAATVSAAIGGRFAQWEVDDLVRGYTSRVERVLGRKLTWDEDDIPLQNIQARVRAPGVLFLANVLNALLITTSNRSEGTRGYCTMDGDTAGGLAPLAGIDKTFLRRWLSWMEARGAYGFFPFPALACVTSQQPSAELRPQEKAQTDEKDLGPYEVGDHAERAAIAHKESPVEVYGRIRARFPHFAPSQLAAWVTKLFSSWSRSQWKRERIAPSFRLDAHDIDPRTGCRFPILNGGFQAELADLSEQAARDQVAYNSQPQDDDTTTMPKKDDTAATPDKPRTRALLIVDAINAFGSQEHGGELPVPDGENIGPVIGRLQDRGPYDVIYACCDEHPEDMFNFSTQCPDKTPYVDTVPDRDGQPATVYPPHAVSGTWGADYLPGVNPTLIDERFPKGDSRDKDSYSGFGNVNLLTRLKEAGVTEVDVVGLVFRICVGHTAIDAARAGFKVRVITDATRDLPIDAFQPIIDEMKKLKVDFVTSEDVLATDQT